MKEILLSIIVLLFTIQCYAQSNTILPGKNKVKKTTVTEYGVDKNGKTGIIKRSTLLPVGKRTPLNPNKKVATPIPTNTTTATFSRATKIPESTPQRARILSMEEQINSIEQEIAKYKNSTSSEEQLRLQKLEHLLEKKKIERVISQ